jgi:hypothetical protein
MVKKNKFYKLQWEWILKYKDINKVICFDYLQKKVKKKTINWRDSTF